MCDGFFKRKNNYGPPNSQHVFFFCEGSLELELLSRDLEVTGSHLTFYNYYILWTLPLTGTLCIKFALLKAPGIMKIPPRTQKCTREKITTKKITIKEKTQKTKPT